MSSQMRYMQGDCKFRVFPTPAQGVMNGSVANPWGTSKQFGIEKGDLLFTDPLSGCVYPASMMPTQITATEATYQLAFAEYFVGIADEKIGLNVGELTFNPNQMYQPTIKVATGGVWEIPCPAQVIMDMNLPIGVYATTSGIPYSQMVDSLAASNTTTTTSYTATATSIVVTSASGAGITAAGQVIEVATTSSTGHVVTATSLSVPALVTSNTAAISYNNLPVVNAVNPGQVLQIGSEQVMVTAVAGSLGSTTLTNAISTSQTSIVAGSVTGMVPGCFLRCGNELMLVVSVNPNTLTIVVVRGYDSTTAATGAAAAELDVYPGATITRAYNGTTAAAITTGLAFTVITSPPEQMLVTNISANTLTVVRAYNGTTAAAIASGAIVSPLSANLSARIGLVAPTAGMVQAINGARAAGTSQPPITRVCIEIQPALRAGGVPTAGTYTGVSGQ